MLSHFGAFGLVLTITLLLALGTLPCWSQATSASTITGVVTDEQDAAIGAAEVKIVDAGTGQTQTTITNETGRYVIVNVTPGTYAVTISKPGFTTYKITAQKVDVGTTITIDSTLRVGLTSTTVEVAAHIGAELQTTNATVGNSLTREALMHLPNLGRDVATLAVFQPAVHPGGNTAGAAQDQNTYTLDGGNNSDDMAGNNTTYTINFTGTGGVQTNGSSSGVMPTPIESIEEFRVQAFGHGADFNSSIGSNVQLVTKRGTNQYHGSVYGYYFATNIGAANSWANNHTPVGASPFTPLPKNHRSRFGTAIGGPVLPKTLAGETYFFFNYEGSRFPNVASYERVVPSKLMRAGIIQVDNGGAAGWTAYNLNPVPVTVDGLTYQPALCGTGPCDPRLVGINPMVKQLWEKFMPLPNNPTGGDRFNLQGFRSTIRTPLNSDAYTGRIDHDFGEKSRFFGTYRFMRLVNLTSNQVDIGGALPGNTLGKPAAMAPRTQVPAYWVAGLTTNISATTTNEFRFNYTRNFWQWGSADAPPQLPGLGGALEIASGAGATTAESTAALIPFNVNTQSIRQRFWNGQDKMVRDDLTIINGNHLFQFGGQYQRNYNFHMRTDNGQGINNQIVYQIGSAGIDFSRQSYPSGMAPSQTANFQNLYSEVLGLVFQPQVTYTRAGKDLQLQPVGSAAFNRSIIPYYNLYFNDTWRVKRSVTVSLGISYGLEMPPYELNGKQIALTYQDGTLVDTRDYLDRRKEAALAGQVYNPILGFATIQNVKGNPKYPYEPFYGGLSPRVSVAWNPNYGDGILGALLGSGRTVIRGGYGRLFGRLNGVNLVLIPLLGPGLLQAVACNGASRDGKCLGTGNVDPSTAFRIGTDGMTAPLPAVTAGFSQPYIPGVGGNPPANDATVLDPRYRPERTDNVTVSIQRQIGGHSVFELGYIGRLIRNEMQQINLDAVPFMTTLGGQTFADAYAKVHLATVFNGVQPNSLTAQPFFEAALGGTSGAYCSGFSSCTAAVASKNASLITATAVSQLWSALYRAPGWVLGRSMISQALPGGAASQGTAISTITSFGFGNYNAMYATYRMRDFHGITAVSNFTWGRALGTGVMPQATGSNTALNVWDLRANYGINSFDVKFIHNIAMYYQPKWFRGQRGLLGKTLGGWTISPLFTAQSGSGLSPTYAQGGCAGLCQTFGEAMPPASTSTFGANAVALSPYTGGTRMHYNVAGSNGVGTNNTFGVNMFEDPATVITQFRKCVLGFDTSCGGVHNLRGPSRWNLDAAIAKDFIFSKDGVGATLSFQFTNVLNHVAMSNPTMTLTTPNTFGRSQSQTNIPRNLEFGLRIHF